MMPDPSSIFHLPTVESPRSAHYSHCGPITQGFWKTHQRAQGDISSSRIVAPSRTSSHRSHPSYFSPGDAAGAPGALAISRSSSHGLGPMV